MHLLLEQYSVSVAYLTMKVNAFMKCFVILYKIVGFERIKIKVVVITKRKIVIFAFFVYNEGARKTMIRRQACNALGLQWEKY